MVLYDILYRTLYSGGNSSVFCFLCTIDCRCYTYERGAHLLVVECFVADVIFQREGVITFYKSLWLIECDDEVRSGDCTFTHFRSAVIKRCFGCKCEVLSSRKCHLCDLHGWFGVDSLNIDSEDVLLGITSAYCFG